VAEREDKVRLLVHDALVQRYFKREYGHGLRYVYHGLLDPTGLRIPGVVEIDDFDFVKYPQIRIASDYRLSDRRIPHIIGPEREICYYAKGSV
jgi:hypothetical protein